MTIDQANAVEIGIIKTEVSHLKEGIAEIKATNLQQTVKLDQMIQTMAEARGGWKTLMIFGSAAGAIGGFFSWAISHWKP